MKHKFRACRDYTVVKTDFFHCKSAQKQENSNFSNPGGMMGLPIFTVYFKIEKLLL